MLIGGFFDAITPAWDAEERDWFDALLEEQDVDIMAWAIGTQPVPERFQGPMMDALQRLDYHQGSPNERAAAAHPQARRRR